MENSGRVSTARTANVRVTKQNMKQKPNMPADEGAYTAVLAKRFPSRSRLADFHRRFITTVNEKVPFSVAR